MRVLIYPLTVDLGALLVIGTVGWLVLVQPLFLLKQLLEQNLGYLGLALEKAETVSQVVVFSVPLQV